MTFFKSSLTAEQLNTGCLIPLQPRNQCQRWSQIYPWDPYSDRGERNGYN